MFCSLSRTKRTPDKTSMSRYQSPACDTSLEPCSWAGVLDALAASHLSSLLRLPEVYAMFATSVLAFPKESLWQACARSYAVSADFWERAAARPAATSFPLGTWRAELKRLVSFNASTRAHGLTLFSLDDFIKYWECRDRAARDTRGNTHVPGGKRQSMSAHALQANAVSISSSLASPILLPAQPAATSLVMEEEPPAHSPRAAGAPPQAAVLRQQSLHGDRAPKRSRCANPEDENAAGAAQREFLLAPREEAEETGQDERCCSHAGLLLHAHLLAEPAQPDDSVDFLKQLYSHPRDHECWMDELEHKYYVHGEQYPFSVSSVWKVFFPQFDTQTSAASSLRRAKEAGLRCLDTSIFNLMQYIWYVERIDPTEAAGARLIAQAVRGANEWLREHESGSQKGPLTVESVQAAMQTLLAQDPLVKPKGPSCYFLCWCLGASEADIREQWHINGALESFKGTFLHKQAELYMQSLAKAQLRSGRQRVPLGVLLAEPGSLQASREAAAPRNVMRLIAPHTASALWDHPALQAFLRTQLRASSSVEFLKFEAWLRANSSLTPYRSEWSIYDEDERLAGQIDSLWLDTAAGDALVMADWKRAKHRLEAEPTAQRRQVFRDETGLHTCAVSPLEGPCAHMYNCDYNHYCAQQNLYAFFLERHYGLHVARILLVQCHPEVGIHEEDFHEAPVTYSACFARSMLDAFRSGWKSLLQSKEDKTEDE